MSSVIKIFYNSSQAIRIEFDLDSLFTGLTSANITSVLWSFKRTRRDADDAILLKTLTDGVVKQDVVAENGDPRIRLSLVIDSIDWSVLSPRTTYLQAIGFKVDTQLPSEGHIPIVSSDEQIIKLQVIDQLLNA